MGSQRKISVQRKTDALVISPEPYICLEINKKSAVRRARDTRFVRACVIEMHTDISQEPFCIILPGDLQGKCRTLLPRPAFCSSLRSRNAHGHVRRGILCGNLQGKCRTHIPRQAFCASLRSRNAHAGRFRDHLD